MMANFLGHEAFNTGITDYLNKHKFGNAKQVSAYFINERMPKARWKSFNVCFLFDVSS